MGFSSGTPNSPMRDLPFQRVQYIVCLNLPRDCRQSVQGAAGAKTNDFDKAIRGLALSSCRMFELDLHIQLTA